MLDGSRLCPAQCSSCQSTGLQDAAMQQDVVTAICCCSSPLVWVQISGLLHLSARQQHASAASIRHNANKAADKGCTYPTIRYHLPPSAQSASD